MISDLKEGIIKVLYIHHLHEHLRLIDSKEMSLYVKGIGGVVLPTRKEKFRFIQPHEVRIVEVQPPHQDPKIKAVLKARVPNPGINNFMPSMRTFKRVNRKIILPLFKSDYKHWKGTLPQADQYDSSIQKKWMYTPFNTAAFVVSCDGYFITPQRTATRARSASNYCLLNGMKYERDEGLDFFYLKS